jgi:hypothetical protein
VQVNEDCVETDVGHWMKQEIKMKLQDVDCKYIDPSCKSPAAGSTVPLSVAAALAADLSSSSCMQQAGYRQPWLSSSSLLCNACLPACLPCLPCLPADLIRSIPATSDNRVYCKMLAHGAVHAAFAGYTAVAVGQVRLRCTAQGECGAKNGQQAAALLAELGCSSGRQASAASGLISFAVLYCVMPYPILSSLLLSCRSTRMWSTCRSTYWHRHRGR